MEMSTLRLLYGDGLKLINGIEVKHPKLSDIVELERKCISDNDYNYNDYIKALTSTRIDVADILWCEMQIWYEDIKTEWEFFIQKCILNKKVMNIFFEAELDGKIIKVEKQAVAIDKIYRDALNFFLGLSGEYVLLDINETDIPQIVLCNVQENKLKQYIVSKDNVKFTENLYDTTLKYLKKINWITSEYMFLKGGSKGAKQYILKNQYKSRTKIKVDKYYVSLDSIISSEIAKGTRYQDIKEYPIYLIYDLYYRNVKINEWQNTMDALHNGCLDTEKNPIEWEKVNWGSVINLD